MTSSTRSPHLGDPTPAASIPPMPGNHRAHDRLTGLVAAGTAMLFTGAFALLGATFDYPDILDREAGEILTRFADAGSDTRVLWYLMLVSSLAFIPLAVLVHRNLRSRGRGGALNDLTAVIGVVAGVLQALGFARWTFAMPYLSDTYVDPATTVATRDAVVVTFEVFHRYLGGALGEHLGFALTAAWTAGVAVLLTRAAGIPRLMPAAGMVVAAAVGAGTVEAAGVAAAGTVVALGYTGFAAWLAWLGISLVVRSRTGAAPR